MLAKCIKTTACLSFESAKTFIEMILVLMDLNVRKIKARWLV